jgi:hypothetical protein
MSYVVQDGTFFRTELTVGPIVGMFTGQEVRPPLL